MIRTNDFILYSFICQKNSLKTTNREKKKNLNEKKAKMNEIKKPTALLIRTRER